MAGFASLPRHGIGHRLLRRPKFRSRRHQFDLFTTLLLQWLVGALHVSAKTGAFRLHWRYRPITCRNSHWELSVQGDTNQHPTHWEVLLAFTLICLGIARIGFQRDQGELLRLAGELQKSNNKDAV